MLAVIIQFALLFLHALYNKYFLHWKKGPMLVDTGVVLTRIISSPARQIHFADILHIFACWNIKIYVSGYMMTALALES